MNNRERGPLVQDFVIEGFGYEVERKLWSGRGLPTEKINDALPTVQGIELMSSLGGFLNLFLSVRRSDAVLFQDPLPLFQSICERDRSVFPRSVKTRGIKGLSVEGHRWQGAS